MSTFYFDLSEISLEKARTKLVEAANSLNASPQQPLFVLVEQTNLFDTSIPPFYSAFIFDQDALESLFEMMNNPEEAWNIYNEGRNDIGSDTVLRIASKKNKKPSQQPDIPEVWEVTKIALYHSGEDEKFKEILKNTPFSEFLNSFPAYKEKQQYKNGVFNAKFNPRFDDASVNERYKGKELGYYHYWRNIRDDLIARKNFCFAKQFVCDGLCDEEKEELVSIPCAIYALRQCDVPESVIRQIYNNHLCYGNTVKTEDLLKLLKANKIFVMQYRLTMSSTKGIKSNPKKHVPSGEGPFQKVELDFYRGHIMKHENHEIIYSRSRGREGKLQVSFLTLLHWAFKENFLIPMNCYEFSKVLSSRSFVSNYKAQTKDILNDLEDPDCLEGDCELFSGVDKRKHNNIVYFDFECSTNEKYHRPYSISYKIGGHTIKHFWADKTNNDYKDVGWEFLEEVRKEYQDQAKTHNFPICVAYAHNLKYDIQPLIKHLERIDPTTKENKLYSLKGVFGKGLNKICIEFRDTLPLLQMSLKKAGETFLSESQKKKIKKEAFPYNLYTYDFFEAYSSGWCPIEVFRKGFEDKKALEDFDTNLNSIFHKKRYKKMFDWENQLINYIEYCHFYCDQDVRVLYKVMEAFNDFMTKNSENPFGADYSPFCYLTISSLAYDYMIKKTILKRDVVKVVNGRPIYDWVPQHPFYVYKCLARFIGQQTVRGGRNMCRDNKMWHYIADPENPKSRLVDYDAVSLYPSAIARLWMTEGKPKVVKGSFSEKEFLEKFTHPDAPEGEFKQYNDGWVHIYSLMCWKDRHFPLLCVKDPKTKINDYQNFHGAVDTWVNAIDLFNLIEYQNATFNWDCAVVWEGARHYECREIIKQLFQLKLHAPSPTIRFLAKLMMNSIYGKSILKPSNYITQIIDSVKWRYLGTDVRKKYEKEDNWRNVFNANAYRIKEFSYHPIDPKHVTVKLHQLDTAYTFVPFGSNVLAMSKRIIGQVMALAEDMEEVHPECSPGVFYTDTDSMHIRIDLLEYTEEAYMEKYGKSIKGTDLGQFHIDFDPLPGNEEILGAIESWFLAKKMYADKLLGEKGNIGYHQRMKGIPGDLIEWDHYRRLYNGDTIEYDLLANGHVSFEIKNGTISSRLEMKREIKVKEAVENLEKDLDICEQFAQALEEVYGSSMKTPPVSPDYCPTEPEPWINKPWDPSCDGPTQPLPPDDMEVEDIDTDDEIEILEQNPCKRLKVIK